MPTSDKVETEQVQIEEIEKQKLQAAFKAEEERQAAIRKEAAVRAEREQLEARKKQLNADIRERERQNSLLTQKIRDF